MHPMNTQAYPPPQGQMTPDQIVDYIIHEGIAWAQHLRLEQRPQGRPLRDDELSHFRGYFDAELLGKVRIVQVATIHDPPFFKKLPELGIEVPFSYADDKALTVVDTILINENLVSPEELLSVLFCECVHVEHFNALGTERLIAKYLHGLLVNGFNYPALPMEQQAYDMQLRFEAGLKVFSVRQEVAAAIAQGRI